MHHPASSPAVAEMQGLYGTFSFPEKLLQRIWLRGDFERTGARTVDGRPVQILHPGKWNLLGGPDFTGARLKFGDDRSRETVGDVEVHLHAVDWNAHGHARDPAYARVILHVVLFPPKAGHVTRGGAGAEIPVLVLLPRLHRSLEEFAADDAVEGLANRPLARLPETLGVLPTGELAALLQRHAVVRWQQKVHFARLRLKRLGWEAACHQTALEVLGYRFNRAPMLRLAAEFPLAQWRAPAFTPETLYTREQEGWSLQGVRPANHPRTRLRQYSAWVQARPDWPAATLAKAGRLVVVPGLQATREVRRHHHFSAWRRELNEALCARVLGGARFNNFVCDGLLPLVTAATERDLFGWWYHWFPGDMPAGLAGGLRELGVFTGRSQPACHGAMQGLLGWLLTHENP